jgi:L-alanine-DL-glutamate epimerase-like enolase superfamily enzyme
VKIDKIEVFQVDLPYANGTYKLSGGREYTHFDATIVCVTTDSGLQGWGESTPFGSNYIASHARGVRAGLEVLAPALLGQDPVLLDRINDRMDLALAGHLDAKNPLDVACWDIFAKQNNRPLCDMLGGRIDRPVPLISSIGSDNPEAMRANVAAHRKAGFKGHSVKIGATDAEGGPTLDSARIQACLADRQPGEWFLADANGGMNPEQVLRLLNQLPAGLDFVLEAPCPTWRETMSVRQRTSVPIMIDELLLTEADMNLVIAQDMADGIGIKISKQGGLTRSRRLRDMCRSAGLVTSIQDTVGSEVAFAAILHLAQSTPENVLRCALDTRSMVSLRVGKLDAPIENGGISAPMTPGLGVTPDRTVLGEPVAVYES